MAVKIGDKVRYLNAVGGGMVTKFQSKDVVLVEEDGFETPVLVRDVVVVKPTNEYNFLIEDSKPKGHKTVSEVASDGVNSYEKEDVSEVQYSWNEREETADGELLSVYLAFVPKDIKKLQTTDMEMFVVNDSNYYMQFAIYTGKDAQCVVVQNEIEPQTKLYIKDVSKLDLNEYEYMRFQAFVYKKIAFKPKLVIDFSVRISPVKFYKLHTFSENCYFDADAMMLAIVENDVMNFEMLIDPIELQKAIQSKGGVQSPRVVNKNVRPEIIEVDLHIHELLEDSRGLSNFDILRVQIERFHEVMRANLKFKGQKIVFIHGKGEGVLRAEVEKELKRTYKYCRYQDASFQQYGFGATQVIIR